MSTFQSEFMTDYDWEIVHSYARKRARRDDMLDAEMLSQGDSDYALLLDARPWRRCCILFQVTKRWDSDAKSYVRIDDVRITRFHFGKKNRDKPDVVWHASVEWARSHFRAMRADGFKEIPTS